MKIRLLMVCLFFGVLFTTNGRLIAQSSSSLSLVQNVQQAFSGGKPVNSVQLTGRVTRKSADSGDTGQVTLTANISGETVVSLSFGSGSRTAKVSATDANKACTWTGDDGVEHPIVVQNCWTSSTWFLPQILLQATGAPVAIRQANSNDGKQAHLQSELGLQPDSDIKSKSYAAYLEQIQHWSQSDLIIDLSTYLPVSLTFTEVVENNPAAAQKIEIRYSDYKNLSGLMIAGHIERYVNGGLEFSIDIDSITAN